MEFSKGFVMKVLVTGGCGYKGHVLIQKLLSAGHNVIAFDTQWFGEFFSNHPDLLIVKGNILDTDTLPFEGVDAIFHLASIANDPCGELNPKLTWETNCLATMKLAEEAQRRGVERFIYASSGSVYGIKEEEKVTENLTLEPLSDYNKTKMAAERILLSYSDSMNIQIVRPATVCGLSPRMRLDVSVNMLTMQALSKGTITVFGGNQIRPNIHIKDICELYVFLLDNPQLTGIFNAGFENKTILEIAELVQKFVDCDIIITESEDPRSYRLDSSKLLLTGFRPSFSVEHAILEIVDAYRKGELVDQLSSYNLKWMCKSILDKGKAA